MMKSLLRALITSTLVSYAGLTAVAAELKDGHPDIYYVKQGDTLWNISSTFLDSPWEWPELWHVNQEIENPHLIYPGDVIRLVYVDGRPRLQLERTGDQPVEKMMTDGSVVKLVPKARVTSLDTAIPTIPLNTIQNFLLEAQVLTSDEIKAAPYVVGGQDKRVVFGKDDTVYARDRVNLWTPLNQGYGFYRVGERYVDPETKSVLGYEALQVGAGKVVDHDKDMLTLYVFNSSEAIRANDRVMSTPERKMLSTFQPSAPSEQINAQIIRLFGRLDSVALYDVVVLNKGLQDGLREGNVLTVKQRGERVIDQNTRENIRMPDINAGTLIVFRAFDRVSYALVIRSTVPIYPNDHAVNPD